MKYVVRVFLATLVFVAILPTVGCEKCCPQPTAPTVVAPPPPPVVVVPPVVTTPVAPQCVYAVVNPTLTVPGAGGRYGLSINTVWNGTTPNSPSCPWTLRSNTPGSLDIFLNAQYSGRAVSEVTSTNGTQVWFVVGGNGGPERVLSFTLVKGDGTTQVIPMTQARR